METQNFDSEGNSWTYIETSIRMEVMTEDELIKYVYQLSDLKIGDKYDTVNRKIIRTLTNHVKRTINGAYVHYVMGGEPENRMDVIKLLGKLVTATGKLKDPTLIDDLKQRLVNIIVVLKNTYSGDSKVTSHLDLEHLKLKKIGSGH